MGVTLVRMNQELLGPRLSSTMKMRMKRILWVLEPSLILGVKFFAPGDDDDDDDSSDDENEDDQFMDGNSSDDDATVPEDEDDDQEHDDVKNFKEKLWTVSIEDWTRVWLLITWCWKSMVRN